MVQDMPVQAMPVGDPYFQPLQYGQPYGQMQQVPQGVQMQQMGAQYGVQAAYSQPGLEMSTPAPGQYGVQAQPPPGQYAGPAPVAAPVQLRAQGGDVAVTGKPKWHPCLSVCSFIVFLFAFFLLSVGLSLGSRAEQMDPELDFSEIAGGCTLLAVKFDLDTR
jgi:hypothetical protein